MVSVTALLTGLVGLMLFVIEKREVKAVFEVHKQRGVLIAENIAQLNLEPFLFWDNEGVERDIAKRIDEKLVYIVFYDRESQPFAANPFIKRFDDIYRKSHLRDDVREGEYHSETRRLLLDEAAGKYLRVLELEAPIFVEGSTRKWGSIKIGLSMEEMEGEIWKTRVVLILVGAAGLLIGVVGSALLARRITRPLKKLVAGTVKISEGDFSHSIEIPTQDEIGNLARSFNEMSRQLLSAKEKMDAAQKKLIQAEKLASIGRISAGIAHEIRNPLTSVKLNIQKVLESQNLDDEARLHLGITQEGVAHIENFVKELLSFTRMSQLNPDLFSVEQIVDESIKMIQDSLSLKKIQVEKSVPKDLPQIRVDGDRIRQVILNILRNACEADDEGGKIWIRCRVGKGNGKKMCITISDNGPGIPEKDRENIFEPFFTTKTTGIGLGLANVRKIVEQHGGTVRVKETDEKGAAFEIQLPLEREP